MARAHRPKPKLFRKGIRKKFAEDFSQFDKCFRASAEWLCRIQSSDGSIAPIINPLSGPKSSTDWSRLPLTAWALSEFGQAIGEDKYTACAQHVFEYLLPYIGGHKDPTFLRMPLFVWANVFFGELALSLGFHREAYESAKKVRAWLNSAPFDPSLISYSASFFAELALLGEKQFLSYALKLALDLKSDFEKKCSTPIHLVAYAGLADTHTKLFRMTGDAAYKEFSERVTDWVVARQAASGAFPTSSASDFVYTRGTAKIFEVLALHPVENKEAILRALRWISSMQYNAANMSGVPPKNRPDFIGSFRHDFANPDAWIDAAGHTLLGAARLLDAGTQTKTKIIYSYGEAEQDTSQFQHMPAENVVAAGLPLGAGEHQKFLYKFPEKTVLSLFSRVTALLQARLDSIVGFASYRIVNPEKEILGLYRKIIDFLYSQGVLSSIDIPNDHYNSAPPFYRCFIQGAYPDGITDGAHPLTYGYSFGKDPSTTFSKAIGEFLERYFLTLYHKNNLLYAAPEYLKEKGIEALDLNLLAGFSTDQKLVDQGRCWNEKSVFGWEKGMRVSDQTPVFVPAQLVYWNYLLNTDAGEPSLRERNTSGCAGMFTKEGAILSGIYELIQRDAFLIHWLNYLTPPKIAPESIPYEGFQNLLQESLRYGFAIHCLNLTMDIEVPTFMVVIEDKSGIGPKFAFGLSCFPDPLRAIHRAFEEAWGLYHYIRKRSPFNLPDDYKPFSDATISDVERACIWAYGDKTVEKKIDFFLKGKINDFPEHKSGYPSKFSSEKAELDFAIKHIEGLGEGYEVYSFMPRHPILDKMGYVSAKVIVPQLVPFYMRENMVPLGAKRLKDIPRKMGFNVGADFNPWPHPFP